MSKGQQGKIDAVEKLLFDQLGKGDGSHSKMLIDKLKGNLMVVLSEGAALVVSCAKDGIEVKKGDIKDKADCRIKIRAVDFLSISNGDLNPQIAMLSEKISIEGKTEMAVYFFNLIAPAEMVN